MKISLKKLFTCKYKAFLEESLMSHLSTNVKNSKMFFEAKNDYFGNPSRIQLRLIMLSKVYRADFPAEGRTFLRTLGAQRSSVRSFVTENDQFLTWV